MSRVVITIKIAFYFLGNIKQQQKPQENMIHEFNILYNIEQACSKVLQYDIVYDSMFYSFFCAVLLKTYTVDSRYLEIEGTIMNTSR